eukprot:UC1_evm1s1380
MLQSVKDPVAQAALGTLFTWAVTAAGAGIVFVSKGSRLFLDASLGFAAGVMLAASYWSLLAPAIEAAEQDGSYGSQGEWAFVPVAAGFALGAYFVDVGERLLPILGLDSPDIVNNLTAATTTTTTQSSAAATGATTPSTAAATVRKRAKGNGSSGGDGEGDTSSITGMRRRSMTTRSQSAKKEEEKRKEEESITEAEAEEEEEAAALRARRALSWRHTLLLAFAVTMHNIPEGLAVGVAFGAVGSSPSATFESARNLALGIGIQNFPEGLAVSLPLYRAGFSRTQAFFYGQLSGLVEPFAGVLGAALVTQMRPLLPYALAFAAGAMVFVVLDDIVPEVCAGKNARVATWGAILGFIVMMSLDVGLG